MKRREVQAYKCNRCDELTLTEAQDAMLECGHHLFDKHRDDQENIRGFVQVDPDTGGAINEQQHAKEKPNASGRSKRH